MQIVRNKVEKLAGADVPVLIQGESGTGKEVLAAAIHRRSCGQNQPFIKITCPAIPAALLESELFGYEKGAFTGANVAKPGRVELAHGGTLFLDEIAELDPALQAKFLQLLQDGQFSRIGGQEDKTVEVHLICATNRDLETEVQAKRFRQDLLYRINVFTIHLPPLRQRLEDIPELADHLLRLYSAMYSTAPGPLSAELLQLMQKYHWPGNIRELDNLVRRYVILGSEQVIGSELLTRTLAEVIPEEPEGGEISLKKLSRQAARELERRIILKALESNGWNRKLVARSLNISYRALLYKIKQGGMPPKRSLPSRAPERVPPED